MRLKPFDLFVISLAAILSSRPVIVLLVLAMVCGPALLLAFVPAAGPALMAAGLGAIAIALSILSGKCAQDALRLQQVRSEQPLFQATIPFRAIVFAWASAALAACVGAAFLVFIVLVFSNLSAS